MKTGFWKRCRLPAATVALGLLVAACVAQPGGAGANNSAAPSSAAGGNRYKVKAETTGFYKLGPQQPGGPDLSLKRDTHLTLIKHSYGYSQVQLDENGGNGIVGNEDLAPLTPQELAAEQAPANANVNPGPNAGGTGAKTRRRTSPRLSSPAPLSPGEEPSLPGSESAPARTGPTPSFRY